MNTIVKGEDYRLLRYKKKKRTKENINIIIMIIE